jgi:hypothetical protein
MGHVRLGVYQYLSGATYEGEWYRNTKHGYGVYQYAKGGSYVGEWVAGRPQGSGVRTFKTGKQKVIFTWDMIMCFEIDFVS